MRQRHGQGLRGEQPCHGTDYQQFVLAYYDGAQRRKKRFSDLEEAKREAELAATNLANGEGQVLRLTSLDRATYLQAVDTLRPLGRQLNLAVAEYADAIKLLPPGVSLRDAVTDFVHAKPAARTLVRTINPTTRRLRCACAWVPAEFAGGGGKDCARAGGVAVCGVGVKIVE